MSSCVNGKRHKLSPEEIVRRHYRCGWTTPDGTVFVTIEFFGGFEYFNTRPYHNYEDFGHGWRVSDGVKKVENECLQCALERLTSED